MPGHILILVENLSVPFDRRVWQESRALVDAGFDVTVICPRGAKQDREDEITIDGVRILRYPLRAATGGPVGYLREYSAALWHTLRLAVKVRRERTSTWCTPATRPICCSSSRSSCAWAERDSSSTTTTWFRNCSSRAFPAAPGSSTR